jgi:uncharacterized protein YecT (DUF1311 family)
MRKFWIAALLPWSSLALASPACPVTLPQDQLNACFENGAAETEKRLNGLLRELRASLNDRNWSLIKESQNLWEKTRSLDCKVEASFIEGPVRTAVTYGCIEKRTRQRLHQLRYYLCPRYDLTGQCDVEAAYE